MREGKAEWKIPDLATAKAMVGHLKFRIIKTTSGRTVFSFQTLEMLVVWWPGVFIDDTGVMINGGGKVYRIGVVRSAGGCQRTTFPPSQPRDPHSCAVCP